MGVSDSYLWVYLTDIYGCIFHFRKNGKHYRNTPKRLHKIHPRDYRNTPKRLHKIHPRDYRNTPKRLQEFTQTIIEIHPKDYRKYTQRI
ncbi:uncharacterized protein DS421_6g173950 [Arachis hypogaea]|nr:uncharacterized protein DS421_6g173950 [Arachis hypogaea]